MAQEQVVGPGFDEGFDPKKLVDSIRQQAAADAAQNTDIAAAERAISEQDLEAEKDS